MNLARSPPINIPERKQAQCSTFNSWPANVSNVRQHPRGRTQSWSVKSLDYMTLNVDRLELLAKDTIEYRRLKRLIHIIQKKSMELRQTYTSRINRINAEKFTGFSREVDTLITRQGDEVTKEMQDKEKELRADVSNHAVVMSHLSKKWEYNFSVDIAHIKNRIDQINRRQYTDRCVEFVVKYGDPSIIDFSQLDDKLHQEVISTHAHKIHHVQVCVHGVSTPPTEFTIDSSTCACVKERA